MRRSFDRLAVAALCAALLAPAGWVPAVRAAGDEGPALIHGIIYRADEITRLAGAQVTAINVNTGRRYSSIHTGTNGAYEIAGLPPGTYDIAIDTPDDNLYVTDGLIDLRENQRLMLSLSLKRSGGAAPGAPSQGHGAQSFTDPRAVPVPDSGAGASQPAGSAEKDSASGEAGATGSGDSAEKPKKSKKPKKPSKPSTGSGATALRIPAPSSSAALS